MLHQPEDLCIFGMKWNTVNFPVLNLLGDGQAPGSRLGLKLYDSFGYTNMKKAAILNSNAQKNYSPGPF